MADHFDPGVYTKKAFELSYALNRLASGVKESRIADYLQDFSLRLLGTFTRKEYSLVGSLTEEIGWFVRLWSDTEVIHSNLGDSLILELSKLKELATEAVTKLGQSTDLKDYLPQSAVGHEAASARKVRQQKSSFSQSAKISINELPNEAPSFHYDSNNRQTAILEFFKTRSVSGNGHFVCRMKDVQDQFQSVSERTLRYDLQKLIEQGALERVGGGPMSAYRLPVRTGSETVTTVTSDRYTI